MKSLASKPQQARRLAKHVNVLFKTISESEKLPIQTDIQQKSKVQYMQRLLKRVIAKEPDAEMKEARKIGRELE